MKTFFVTGGAGFIGSHFIKRLLADGYHVINIDNFDPFYDRQIKESNILPFRQNNNFQHITGSILDKKLIESIFAENEIDVVAHFAAKAGVRPSIADPIGYFETNVQGTLNILELMKRFDVKKMMFASSSSVYGNNENIPFSETDNVDNPISPYAASKKACELICATYNNLYNINIFAYRFFTVYGPAQRPEMAIAKFANEILNDEQIILFDGKGETARDYTYIDDIIDGLMASIDVIKGFEIYNLGESETVKLIDLVIILERQLGKEAKITFGERQPGDVEITYADITKAKKQLGYNPRIKIEEGIERYCKWLKEKSGNK